VTGASLAADIVAIARLEGRFRLRSGTIADHYFDKYRFEGNPALLRRVAEAMLALLPKQVELLAGLELGGVPIATAMSLISGLPTVFVRKQAKDYGTCLAIEGGDVTGKHIMLVEDVITTGGAVADAARVIEDAGARLIGVTCAIWRGIGEPAIAKRPDICVRAALTAEMLSHANKKKLAHPRIEAVSGSAERVDSASRLIAAPVERVYRALVDPASVEQWLPPEGAAGTVEAFEPRPGGAFRMTLRFVASGIGKTTRDTDVVVGRFVELEPDRRIVQEFDFISDDPAYSGTMRMTWTMAPQGDGTLVTITAEHVPAGIDPEDHAQGLASSLANLAAYVEV
jgi:orotate phosphoribosyltransferase